MTWFRSLRRTPASAPSPASRRQFFAGAGALAGSALLADASWAGVAARADAYGIEPGTLVDAQGRRLEREPMSAEPLIGQLMQVGFNFAPRGWAFCDGQLLAISQNSALFSLLGTTYGGDGRTTFGLPDLRGRYALHPGTGAGLTQRRQGETGGQESVTLSANEVPSHTHDLSQVQVRGTGTETVGLATGGDRGTAATAATGGGQAHNNMPPFLGIYHCIALQGVFPSRS